ncbi:MAG: ABC transporter substrate-binding protein [Ktedonobacterales bacterium]
MQLEHRSEQTSSPEAQPRPAVFRRVAAVAMLALLIAGALAACGQSTSAGGKPLRHITLGLTYVPNVQFAPFYVAKQLGYYKDAGLDVTLRHHTFTEDEFSALVGGKEDAIFAGGDEMLQARSKGVPIVYVAQVFTKYPVTLIVPANSSIQTAADLRGHSIGVPGKYGADYIGLLALLKNAGLRESDVHIQTIGFQQVPTLLAHRVDAVMGYINGDAVAFQQANFPIRTLSIGDGQPLISNGLGALESELQAHPNDIKALVQATLRGLEYTLAHPTEAFNISKNGNFVPGLADPKTAATQTAVLQATLPLWQQGAKPGYNDPAAWQSMASFLQAQGQLTGAVDVTKAISNDYLPA